jgi:hypothetical protein
VLMPNIGISRNRKTLSARSGKTNRRHILDPRLRSLRANNAARDFAVPDEASMPHQLLRKSREKGRFWLKGPSSAMELNGGTAGLCFRR